MSLESSPSQNAGNSLAEINAEPFYTNEDVVLLHRIIVLAQQLLPNLPERERLPTNALFNAYYDILPKVGVNADHDSRYARILFKIGGLRGPGTLLEKFVEVLSRMGIEVEFDHIGNEDIYSDDPQANFEAAASSPISQGAITPSQTRHRRNSESSAWDLRNEPTPLRSRRRRSLSPARDGLASVEPTQQSFLQEIGFAQSLNPTRTIPAEENGDQPDHNSGPRVASGIKRPRIESEDRVSPQFNAGINWESYPQTSSSDRPTTGASIPQIHDIHAPGATGFVHSGSEEQIPNSLDPFRGQAPNQGYGSLPEVKSSHTTRHHLSFYISRKLRSWRDQALRLQEDNANCNIVALHQERKVLLGAVVERWHDRLAERRKIAETERFFAHLERRAARARDIDLVKAALQYWMTSALDGVERTSLARRHIIRTRTFNAWRDVTAVNQLKVRRQVIQKFFGIWKSKHAVVSANDATAVQKYEGNLVEKIYRKWIQALWATEATRWWSERAKHKALTRWTFTARTIWNNNHIAQEKDRVDLTQKAWRIWGAKTNDRVLHTREAGVFRQNRVFSGALKRWRDETRAIPAKMALQTDMNGRLLRGSFDLWLRLSRQERQASAIDRLRIIGEAWTTWRHKFRFQVLRARVNERIILQSIYKWVLAERATLAKRLTNRRLLSSCLHSWAERCQPLREQRWDSEYLAQDFAARKAGGLMLKRWHSQLQARRQREVDAVQYSTHVLGGFLSQWSERGRHLQQLERWSRDAEFYFLASKSLKRWKSSTESAKREKRKVAYGQIRRTSKMNLARRMLFGWRHQAQELLALQDRASELNQNRTVIIGMNIFDQWRARTDELREMEVVWRERVIRKLFSVWRDRAAAFQDLEVEAIMNFEERQQSSAVKKWSLLTLQLKAQTRYATEIREKNLKRSFRKTFAYWQQRTAQKLPPKSSYQETPNSLSVTARAENWSELGEDDTEADEWAKGLDEATASTPIPGYLRTPSRRLGRVTAAAARFSSTTPRAPLPSPFERQMRAQYSGGLLPSFRRGPGKSQLSTGMGFADIAGTDVDDGHGAL